MAETTMKFAIDHALLNLDMNTIKEMVEKNPHLFTGQEGAEAITSLVHGAVDRSITVVPSS